MGKVIMSGIVPLLSVPSIAEPNFADNTWAQIIKVCQTNTVPDTWVVGNQKSMTIGGTDYVIDIIGKNHDIYSSGGTAPLTFQMHDCYVTGYAMNSSNTNVGGWTSCAMRTTHLPTILALMPNEVQNGIKEVNKLTSAGNESTIINTTADKLFLLSEVEIYGRTPLYAVEGEGTKYSYYNAKGSTEKNQNGYSSNWWERSPVDNNSTGFGFVDTAGEKNNANASGVTGVSFAFCF